MDDINRAIEWIRRGTTTPWTPWSSRISLNPQTALEEAALGIVRAARQHDKITSLGLGGCNIGPTGAKEIADYVQGSAVLTSLDLSLNQLDAEAGCSCRNTRPAARCFSYK